MTTVQPRAVFLGGLAAAVVALPVALVGQVVVEREGTTSNLLAFVFLAPILLAFMAGGFVAARRATASPLTNGALAAVGAFALIQGVGVVRRLASGEALSPASLAFAAFLAYSSGLVGALGAQRFGSGRTAEVNRGGEACEPRS